MSGAKFTIVLEILAGAELVRRPPGGDVGQGCEDVPIRALKAPTIAELWIGLLDWALCE